MPTMVRAGAHPRSRGENFKKYASKGSEAGSSPLTRGKPVSVSQPGSGGGSSPLTRGKRIDRHGSG